VLSIHLRNERYRRLAVGLKNPSLPFVSAIEHGLAHSRRARWKHGFYSAKAMAEQKRVRELLAQSRELLKRVQAG
jgi:hypothetical protein